MKSFRRFPENVQDENINLCDSLRGTIGISATTIAPSDAQTEAIIFYYHRTRIVEEESITMEAGMVILSSCRPPCRRL